MFKRILTVVECLIFSVCVLLAVLWAYTGDGKYEPFTYVCAVTTGGLELYRRFFVHAIDSVQAVPADETSTLLGWLLDNVPSKDLSETLPKALKLAKLVDDKGFEKWVRCELNGYSPETMLETDVVPEYRTVVGVHLDAYRNVLMVDEDLAFVNETRLRWGAKELEKHAATGETLTIQDPGTIALLKKHMHVNVVAFQFSTASIYGILEVVRSRLLDQVHEISACRSV